MATDWHDEILAIARGIRRRVLAQVLAHGGGYLSQACSSAEILATLYGRVMRLGPSLGPPIPPPFRGVPGPDNPDVPHGGAYNGPQAPELDRFFFSPVHYSLALYAVLVEVGRLAPEALEQLDQDGTTMETIGAEHSPGIACTAGSLAQAISVAGGVALGRRIKGETGRVWAFISDGELQEGQLWEAVAAARHHGLTNLGVYVDVNAQQCDGPMSGVMTVDPAQQLRAFGAEVREVDGHDVEALAAAARPPTAGPLAVLCRTDPCRGIDVLRQRDKLHHVRLRGDEERRALERALEQLER
jgi:transketolase